MSHPKKKRFGNENYVLISGLLIIAFIWSSTIFLIPIASSFITNRSDECIAMNASKTADELKEKAPACQNVLSRYGATGDLFGSVTSLFSALGFFAVAATLHIEAKARRGQLKPFVVAQLRSPGCTAQNADIVNCKSIVITIPLTVKNLGEPAINVEIQVGMRIGKVVQEVSKTTLGMPLVKDLAGEEVSITAKIEGEVYRSFVEALSILDADPPTDPPKAPMIFILDIVYTNLAGVNWVTKTEYIISTINFADRTRFVHLFHKTEKVGEEWSNRSVALNAVVVKDSWSYGEDLS